MIQVQVDSGWDNETGRLGIDDKRPCIPNKGGETPKGQLHRNKLAVY